MSRKPRADQKVGNLAKRMGISEKLIRHENGRKVRKDARVGGLRKKNKKNVAG